jgi:hypothetical protein
MDVVAHILLSIAGSAVIAVILTPILNHFGQDSQFLVMWIVCFCAWWGFIVVGDC